MIFQICEQIQNKLTEANIRLEYSSLLNATGQFTFRQEGDDYSIIVPREIHISNIKATWSIAHEYGHYIIRIDDAINEYRLSVLEKEELAWQKGKMLLDELALPIVEEKDTYDGFAEICLDSYKQDKYFSPSPSKGCQNLIFFKWQFVLSFFVSGCRSFSIILNGLIIAYILLGVVGISDEIKVLLPVAINFTIVSKVLQAAFEKFSYVQEPSLPLGVAYKVTWEK